MFCVWAQEYGGEPPALLGTVFLLLHCAPERPGRSPNCPSWITQFGGVQTLKVCGLCRVRPGRVFLIPRNALPRTKSSPSCSSTSAFPDVPDRAVPVVPQAFLGTVLPIQGSGPRRQNIPRVVSCPHRSIVLFLQPFAGKYPVSAAPAPRHDDTIPGFIHCAHHIHHLRLHLRILFESTVNVPGNLVLNLARRHAVPSRFAGIRIWNMWVINWEIRSARSRSLVIRRSCTVCITAKATSRTARTAAPATPTRWRRTYSAAGRCWSRSSYHRIMAQVSCDVRG